MTRCVHFIGWFPDRLADVAMTFESFQSVKLAPKIARVFFEFRAR